MQWVVVVCLLISLSAHCCLGERMVLNEWSSLIIMVPPLFLLGFQRSAICWQRKLHIWIHWVISVNKSQYQKFRFQEGFQLIRFIVTVVELQEAYEKPIHNIIRSCLARRIFVGDLLRPHAKQVVVPSAFLPFRWGIWSLGFPSCFWGKKLKSLSISRQVTHHAFFVKCQGKWLSDPWLASSTSRV